ncbi:MAG: hypothetical protein AB7P14_25050 [Blastocatellales bacterium]
MDFQFVTTEFFLSTDHWFSAEALTEQMVSPAVATALQADALLTLALQKADGLTSSVEFRRNAGWTDVRFEVGLRRDVLMKTGDSMNIDEY